MLPNQNPNPYAAGVKERFGAADLEQLERDGEVPLEWRGGKGKQPIRWTLTKKARSPAPSGKVRGGALSCPPSAWQACLASQPRCCCGVRVLQHTASTARKRSFATHLRCTAGGGHGTGRMQACTRVAGTAARSRRALVPPRADKPLGGCRTWPIGCR